MISWWQQGTIPLDQLRQVMITSQCVTLDAGMISAVSGEYIRLILCDNRHMPACEVVPIGRHHEAAGAVMDQAKWKQDRKDAVWQQIVTMKLSNQMSVLRLKNRMPPPQFAEYCASVEPGNRTHREAVAARMYFSSLFGRDFRRQGNDTTNSKLNYGYSILCSAFSRALAAHGYHTGLGIHHCSRNNPVNLSCDLMEPFRPLVDSLVFDSGNAELDWELKKKLIAVSGMYCRINNKTESVEDAIDIFTLETLKAAKQGNLEIPEVRF